MQSPTFGNCVYSDTHKDILQGDGEPTGLRRQSVQVFKYLAQNHDQVLLREDILATVWNEQVVTDDSLSQCISEIRKAIGDKNRQILKTVPRRGYMLLADTPSKNAASHSQPDTTKSWYQHKYLLVLGVLLVVVIGFSALTMTTKNSIVPDEDSSTVSISVVDNTAAYLANETLATKTLSLKAETISIAVNTEDTASELIVAAAKQTRVALSRYKSVAVVDNAITDYSIKLTENGNTAEAGLTLELISNKDKSLIFAETLSSESITLVNKEQEGKDDQASTLGIRIAGMVASPGGGAIARHLIKTARGKPAGELSRAQCYAFGYDCTNCSGELDPITKIAEACLAKILKENPTDPQAWGLQSTIYAHQYLWSSALSEPQRTNLKDRLPLRKLAIDAANKAELFSDGSDTSVYWGMAQAYAASCQLDKLRTVVNRGLQINPHDPSLLGAFGSWIAYSGDWDAGVDMINKALEIEPRHYKRWWLFPKAKRHYALGEYELALKVFRKAYNERNWLSHLQLAYTLPHLDRIEEAIEERKAFERLYPGATIENVLQFYKTYCFQDSFLEKMKWALTQAGLPSRGSSDDLNNIRPTEAQVMSVNGFTTEYKDVGSGTPIVFVHGSISDYRAWSHYQNPISENHRFISYSLRYAGSQDWPDDGDKYGIATDAKDLIALIEKMDIGPVFTVSWSRGGRVTGLAALLRPDLFLGNVHFEPIVNALGIADDALVIKARDQYFSRFDDSDHEFALGNIELGAAIVLENVFELDRGRFDTEIMPLRAMNRLSAKNMALQNSVKDVQELDCDKLAKTQVPTLVVVGEKTNAWWQHIVQRYHECIPGSEYATMSGVNHDGPIRRPDSLTELVLEFVDSRSTN